MRHGLPGPMMLLLLIMLGSCSRFSGLNTDLSKNKKLWQDAAISSYTLELQRLCFCPEEITNPVRLIVKNNAISSVTYRDSGALVADKYKQLFPDIEGLFAFLEKTIANNADKIDVSWNESYNFPQTISVDFVTNAADDELSFKVLAFTPSP